MNWKLAKVDHFRCDEVRASTYVWISPDLSADEFEKLCIDAKTAYLLAESGAKNARTPHPGWQPPYEMYPNLPVAEVKALHEQRLAAWKADEEKRDAARQSFATILEERSDGRIKGFYEVKPDTETTVYWGHQHGTLLEYGETDPDKSDLKGSLAKSRSDG